MSTKGGYVEILEFTHFARVFNVSSPVIPLKKDKEEKTKNMCSFGTDEHGLHIKSSEKAFAYKMKLEAMKSQGKRTDLTASQVGTKLEKGQTEKQFFVQMNVW